MPGRPRTLLKKVDALEVQAFELADAVSRLCPNAYRKKPDRDREDEVAEAWYEALSAVELAWRLIQGLGYTLREKIGIRRDGPTADRELSERAKPGGASGHVDVDTRVTLVAGDAESPTRPTGEAEG